ncbi:hypothetical protein K503DRAFT_71005 [Rhizopogon vinicolor AM-OR11-026]|uniref:Uncharacterized protein n=1 Tax=Rhizopogon vinicolor AM-OR11-026 TaxID=1314800 RepID=A0A1B7N461_9AGAM|nr:hypothetical protein K503DRAFT_71005 [Rhizopogon vinicolor AM-OR11-026]
MFNTDTASTTSTVTPLALSWPQSTSHWHTLSEQPSQTQTSSASPSTSPNCPKRPYPLPSLILVPYNTAQLIARNKCGYMSRRRCMRLGCGVSIRAEQYCIHSMEGTNLQRSSNFVVASALSKRPAR